MGPGVGPWERASTPEPQVSVYKVEVMTGSIPEKCKEKMRLVQNISSVNAATHCHSLSPYPETENGSQASIY